MAVHSDAAEPPWPEGHCGDGSDLSAPAGAGTDVRSGLRWPKPSQSCGTGPRGCCLSSVPMCPATGDAPVPKDLHITDSQPSPRANWWFVPWQPKWPRYDPAACSRSSRRSPGSAETNRLERLRLGGRPNNPRDAQRRPCRDRFTPFDGSPGVLTLASIAEAVSARAHSRPCSTVESGTARPSPVARSLSSIGVSILPGTGVVASHSSGVALALGTRRNLGRGLSLPNRT